MSLLLEQTFDSWYKLVVDQPVDLTYKILFCAIGHMLSTIWIVPAFEETTAAGLCLRRSLITAQSQLSGHRVALSLLTMLITVI